MKIYFAGSIRGGRKDQEIYFELINHLKKHGEVVTEHISSNKISNQGEIEIPNKVLHERDFNWMISSDVVVAEVSTPSLGVGYEIGRAIEKKKKILCLHKPQEGKRLSAMIAGSPDLIVKNYQTIEEAKQIIDIFFKNLN